MMEARASKVSGARMAGCAASRADAISTSSCSVLSMGCWLARAAATLSGARRRVPPGAGLLVAAGGRQRTRGARAGRSTRSMARGGTRIAERHHEHEPMGGPLYAVEVQIGAGAMDRVLDHPPAAPRTDLLGEGHAHKVALPHPRAPCHARRSGSRSTRTSSGSERDASPPPLRMATAGHSLQDRLLAQRQLPVRRGHATRSPDRRPQSMQPRAAGTWVRASCAHPQVRTAPWPPCATRAAAALATAAPPGGTPPSAWHTAAKVLSALVDARMQPTPTCQQRVAAWIAAGGPESAGGAPLHSRDLLWFQHTVLQAWAAIAMRSGGGEASRSLPELVRVLREPLRAAWQGRQDAPEHLVRLAFARQVHFARSSEAIEDAVRGAGAFLNLKSFQRTVSNLKLLMWRGETRAAQRHAAGGARGAGATHARAPPGSDKQPAPAGDLAPAPDGARRGARQPAARGEHAAAARGDGGGAAGGATRPPHARNLRGPGLHHQRRLQATRARPAARRLPAALRRLAGRSGLGGAGGLGREGRARARSMAPACVDPWLGAQGAVAAAPAGRAGAGPSWRRRPSDALLRWWMAPACCCTGSGAWCTPT